MDQGSPQVLHNYGTRKRQNSVIRPSQRLRQQSINSPSSPLSYQPRRIKPLGCVASNANSSVYLSLKLNCVEADKNDQSATDKAPAVQPTMTHIDFPPSHVVLHPEDASNKVFIAMGRAFLSVVSVFFSKRVSSFLCATISDLIIRCGSVCVGNMRSYFLRHTVAWSTF